MSTENLTQFTKAMESLGFEILPPVAKAIDEQRVRLWRLRSLIEVTSFAVDHESGDEIEDLNAVLAGLVELADSIHEALETQTIAERVAELTEDEAQREAFVGGEAP